MFYLYFRDRARHGEYIETEYSYILLYLFEIINIGSEIPAQTGARLMALIWRAYRDAFPALDRTAGEWLIDYCLINCVPLPLEIISGFLSGVCKTLKNPDVYLGGVSGIKSFDILSVYSSYDFRSSKRYLGNEALFDLHIPAAAMLGAAALANEPMPSDMPTLHTVSRAYTGALYIGYGVKIEVETRSLLRSKSFCETVSSLIKTCENRIRAHIGAGKLSIKRPLPPSVSTAINGYFDNVFYDDEKKKTNASQDEEYLKLYEPENTGVADISRALGIERDAWQTAIELDADILEEDEPIPLASAEHDGDNGDPAFPAELIDLLAAAADGVLYDECRRKGINPIEAERLINEAAYDIIGDALMENGALIEDYRTEAEEIILRGRSAAKENR